MNILTALSPSLKSDNIKRPEQTSTATFRDQYSESLPVLLGGVRLTWENDIKMVTAKDFEVTCAMSSGKLHVQLWYVRARRGYLKDTGEDEEGKEGQIDESQLPTVVAGDCQGDDDKTRRLHHDAKLGARDLLQGGGISSETSCQHTGLILGAVEPGHFLRQVGAAEA